MPISLPKYIDTTGIIDHPIEHSWDDDDPEFVYARLDERLQHRIAKISDRGQLVLSCGFAEWIGWRLKKFSDDPMLFNKIEAVYTGIIDWRYLSTRKLPNRQDWKGPSRGPLWAAAELLNRLIDLTKRKQFASPESVCISFLVLHIIPDPKPFKDWRRFAIQRLSTLYPLDMENVLGLPVPRESLDPDLNYKPGQESELLGNFLSNLDPTTNPFLCTSEEMFEAGFEGTPYMI